MSNSNLNSFKRDGPVRFELCRCDQQELSDEHSSEVLVDSFLNPVPRKKLSVTNTIRSCQRNSEKRKVSGIKHSFGRNGPSLSGFVGYKDLINIEEFTAQENSSSAINTEETQAILRDNSIDKKHSGKHTVLKVVRFPRH
jgi:hypothetical protein